MDGFLFVFFSFAGLAFLFWIAILVPRRMAMERGRDPLLWVLVSLFASPILAILLLLLLGPAARTR